MKSEERLKPGRASRTARIFALYSSTVWPRFIMASTRSEPDCTGRCRWLASSGTLRNASVSVGENSTGCEVVKRMRSMPGTSAAYWISSPKSATASSSAVPSSRAPR